MDLGDSDKCYGRGRGLPRERKQLRRPFSNSLQSGSQYLPSEKSVVSDQTSAAAGLTAANQKENVASCNNNAKAPFSEKGEVSTATTRAMESSLSPFAKEFFPQNWRETNDKTENEDVEDTDGALYTVPLQELREFVYEVTESPARFETHVENLTEVLNECELDGGMLKAIVSTIVDQAIMEQNFRYNGARLCNHFLQNLSITTKDGTFRQLLLKRCEDEQNKRETLAKTEEGLQYLRGLTMFTAELFVHIDVEFGDRKCKVFCLGHGLPQLLDTLLSVPTPENLKCVSQVLKLSGALMEDYEKSRAESSSSAPETHKIFAKINSLIANEEIPRNVRDLLTKIVDLRSSNWGREASSPVVASDTFIGQDSVDKPVLYGPDGTPISAEEERFLMHYHYGASDLGLDSGDGEEEMDDEIAVAFEEFLRESGQ